MDAAIFRGAKGVNEGGARREREREREREMGGGGTKERREKGNTMRWLKATGLISNEFLAVRC